MSALFPLWVLSSAELFGSTVTKYMEEAPKQLVENLYPCLSILEVLITTGDYTINYSDAISLFLVAKTTHDYFQKNC